MTFAQPLWIIAGLIVCIGTLFLFHNLQVRRVATLEKFAAAHLLDRLTRNVSGKRQLAKKMIFILALFFCFLALARPQYGFRWEDVKSKGIDILFALDTSKSMLTEDVKPDRLERAKLAIMDFVDQLHGDRVGLLPFAGSAYLMCPLTGDYQAFEDSLRDVDTNTVPRGGTNIAAAIKEAESVLSNKTDYKLLILVTDGENLEGDALAAAQEAAKKGLRIFTVGVGTQEGEIIPISSGKGKGFVKDASGNFVVSHLDEATLTQIADKSNGLYVPLGNKGQGLETIYRKKLSLVPKEELTQRRRKVPLERFQWPLAVAIALLALEFMIGTRKSRPFRLPFGRNGQNGKDGKIIGSLIILITFSLFSLPLVSHASDGEKSYRQGDYQKALEQYSRLLKKHPDDPKLQYDAGAAAYKNKKLDEAIAAFTAALKSKDLALQEKAYYNRGNAYFKKGEETLKTDTDKTLAQWKEALDSYTASLQLAPDDQDALYNRKLVQKKMDELKKNEKNQQKKDQDQKNNDKQNQDKKTGGQKDQQGQNTGDSKQEQKPNPGQNEQNGDEKKQDSSAAQAKAGQQKQAAAQARQEQAEAAKDKAEAALDNERRKEGKMTREDAEQLLNSLKNDEGKALNFIPNDEKSKDEKPGRDW